MRHYSRAEMEQIYNSIVGERLVGGAEQDVRTASVVQNYVLGSKKETENGLKLFRYGQAGAGAACVLGILHQSPVPAPLQVNLVPLANYAIGTRVIGLTVGNAVVGLNEYAGGWLYVSTATGQGECLRVLSHLAALANAACLFTCLDTLTVAFDATTRCSLVANPYAGVTIHLSPPTAHLVGVPQVTIPASNFGWFQRRGPTVILCGTAAPVVNSRTNAGILVNGSIDVDVAATVLCAIGEVMRTDIATSSALVNLKLE